MAAFRITKGMGKIFFEVSVDLEKDLAEIEFCGITQQRDVTMTSFWQRHFDRSKLA